MIYQYIHHKSYIAWLQSHLSTGEALLVYDTSQLWKQITTSYQEQTVHQTQDGNVWSSLDATWYPPPLADCQPAAKPDKKHVWNQIK